jgi:hypothetical protein
MAINTSWFAEGPEGTVDGGDDALKPKKPWRFWMPVSKKPGDTRDITFLDPDVNVFEIEDDGVKKKIRVKSPFVIQEHSYQTFKGGKASYENETCRRNRETPECPMCDAGIKRRQMALWTVYDHAEYVNKKGEKVTKTLRVLAVPTTSGMYAEIMEMIQEYGNLRGLRFTVRRNGEQSTGCGTSLKESRVSKRTELTDEELPVNYLEFFAPAPLDDLRRRFTPGASTPPPEKTRSAKESTEDVTEDDSGEIDWD